MMIMKIPMMIMIATVMKRMIITITIVMAIVIITLALIFFFEQAKGSTFAHYSTNRTLQGLLKKSYSFFYSFLNYQYSKEYI